ncbi:MAG: hypothetical protein QOE64_2392 [Frankiales bacterium]|nr:hypothetical protein [Frankiales bacterium]
MIGAAVLSALHDAVGPEGVWFGAHLAAPTELLVRDDAVPLARGALGELGFVAVGPTWARLGADGVEALRVRAHPHFDELLEASGVVDGLVQPAARHQLLLAAERLVSDPAVETTDVVALARQALQQDPDAWRAALKRGLDWGLWRALAHLERGLAGASVTATDRAEARRELDRLRGPSELVTAAPAVLPLSGVDGAGKSLQARALRDSLARAGVPCAVEWTRVAADRRLDSIARPVARLTRALRRRPAGAVRSVQLPGADPERSAARSLREGSRLVGTVWAYVVVTLTAMSQRRATALHVKQGRTVIHDRYLVDAVVQLRDDYGVRCGRVARALLRRLIPRPATAVLLLVSPEEALRRKEEQYGLADLERLTARYRRAAAELEVTVVDGQRPPDTISAELFTLVWARLAQDQTTSPSRSRSTG